MVNVYKYDEIEIISWNSKNYWKILCDQIKWIKSGSGWNSLRLSLSLFSCIGFKVQWLCVPSDQSKIPERFEFHSNQS